MKSAEYRLITIIRIGKHLFRKFCSTRSGEIFNEFTITNAILFPILVNG